MRVPLDDDILEALRSNSRDSAAAIARRIGAPASTVKRRIDALIEQGAISRFTIETPRATDASVSAIIEIFCRGNVTAPELRALVRTIADVSLAVSVAGTADAMLVVHGGSAEAISHIVEGLRASPKIERTRTSIIFEDLLA